MAVVNLNVNQITGTSSKHGTSFRSWQGQGPEFFLPEDLNFTLNCLQYLGSGPGLLCTLTVSLVTLSGTAESVSTPSHCTLSSVQCAVCGGRGEE